MPEAAADIDGVGFGNNGQPVGEGGQHGEHPNGKGGW